MCRTFFNINTVFILYSSSMEFRFPSVQFFPSRNPIRRLPDSRATYPPAPSLSSPLCVRVLGVFVYRPCARSHPDTTGGARGCRKMGEWRGDRALGGKWLAGGRSFKTSGGLRGWCRYGVGAWRRTQTWVGHRPLPRSEINTSINEMHTPNPKRNKSVEPNKCSQPGLYCNMRPDRKVCHFHIQRAWGEGVEVLGPYKDSEAFQKDTAGKFRTKKCNLVQIRANWCQLVCNSGACAPM